MLKIDPAQPTIALAAVIAVAVGFGATRSVQRRLDQRTRGNRSRPQTATAPTHQWAASATGRVEPKFGEVRMASQVPGKIIEVLAPTNDKVQAGDLLVRLDDQEIYAKIVAAAAEVGVREREREEEAATGLALERQQAGDEVAKPSARCLPLARHSMRALRVRATVTGDDDQKAAQDKVEQRAKPSTTPRPL